MLKIRLLNGGLGNQIFQTSHAFREGISVGIFFDRKRALSKEVKKLYKVCFDFSKIPILRNILYYFWHETATVSCKKYAFIELFSGYSLNSNYIDLPFSKEIEKLFEISKPLSKISTLHLRLTDYVQLGRGTLSNKHTIPDLHYFKILKTDAPESEEVQSLINEFGFKLDCKEPIDDWCDIISSDEVVCSNSTFSISAALIGQILYGNTFYVPSQPEVEFRHEALMKYNDSFYRVKVV
ncbi:MAG: hypothetical protein COA59_07205 [Colwellia sp.]|jgi:hypothetical protein|nr:MAG: hypothetical protein COA59_07205 [Colwellia sp.]